MASIKSYSAGWEVRSGKGRFVIEAEDGQKWPSPLLDALTFTALAAVVHEGAQLTNGWIVAGSDAAFDATTKAMSGESPFPW